MIKQIFLSIICSVFVVVIANLVEELPNEIENKSPSLVDIKLEKESLQMSSLSQDLKLIRKIENDLIDYKNQLTNIKLSSSQNDGSAQAEINNIRDKFESSIIKLNERLERIEIALVESEGNSPFKISSLSVPTHNTPQSFEELGYSLLNEDIDPNFSQIAEADLKDTAELNLDNIFGTDVQCATSMCKIKISARSIDAFEDYLNQITLDSTWAGNSVYHTLNAEHGDDSVMVELFIMKKDLETSL